MKYSIIIPCYNEGENIYNLVDNLETNHALYPYDVEFVLVENGSKDNTRDILNKICKENFSIVYIDENIGYGYGIKKGMEAATGDYIGWIHADLQVPPEEIFKLIEKIELQLGNEECFFKGLRNNRTITEHFFTAAMSCYASIVLRCHLYDIGAIPVLFHRNLLLKFDYAVPYDFSIETYVYYKAKKNGYKINRFNVFMKEREKGKSSWNNGLKSRIRQSKLIAKDIIKIKKGKPVR